MNARVRLEMQVLLSKRSMSGQLLTRHTVAVNCKHLLLVGQSSHHS